MHVEQDAQEQRQRTFDAFMFDQRRKAALEGVRSVQARGRPSARMKRLPPEAPEDAIAEMLDNDDQ